MTHYPSNCKYDCSRLTQESHRDSMIGCFQQLNLQKEAPYSVRSFRQHPPAQVKLHCSLQPVVPELLLLMQKLISSQKPFRQIVNLLKWRVDRAQQDQDPLWHQWAETSDERTRKHLLCVLQHRISYRVGLDLPDRRKIQLPPIKRLNNRYH